MKKRYLALILTVAMIFGLAVPALAAVANTSTFDADVLYTARNNGSEGAGWRNLGADPEVLTDGGNVFEILVTNSETGEEYKSFCAGPHSAGLAGDGGSGKDCDGYFQADVYKIGDGHDDLIGALNYINNIYGSVDSWTKYYTVETSTRLISQAVIWNLFCGVDIDEMTVRSSALSKMGYYVDPIMAALANTDAKGDIIGFAYLTCATGGEDHEDSCQPQIIPIFDDNQERYGGFSIDKTVDGMTWELWTQGYEAEEILALLDGISFNLYKVTDDGDNNFSSVPFATGNLDLEGKIVFENKAGGYPAGWYAIVEVLTGEAAKVFKAVDPLYIQINAEGKIVGDTFDAGASYKINNGYGGGYQLGYPGLNHNGDIFHIGVENINTGVKYDSFCGNGGSTGFAGENKCTGGYMVATSFADTKLLSEFAAPYADFVRAYNYIYDKYGENLDAVRPVVQIVTWNLLGSLKIPSEAFDKINWAAVERGTAAVKGVPNAKNIVLDVLDNYKTFKSEGAIKELVLMVCNKQHNPGECQPQLVPIYDGISFNNETTETGYIGISLVKTVDGTEFATWIAAKDSAEMEQWLEWLDTPGFITFELYAVDDNTTIPTGTPIKSLPLDTEGKIAFPNLENGWYAVKEVLSEDAAKIFEPKEIEYFYIEDEDITGTLNNTTINLGSLTIDPKASMMTTTKYFKEMFERERTPYKTISEGYGSVTATNVGVKTNIVANANHFTYAKLSKADLVEGVVLDMVVGNKINVCGSAFVKLVNGKLEITINDTYKSSFGAVAFDGFIPVTKNGNIHSMGIFNHNGVNVIDIYNTKSFQSSDKKGANYDKDWADYIKNVKTDDKFIYLYIHGDFTFDLTDKNDPNYQTSGEFAGYILPNWSDPVKTGEKQSGVSYVYRSISVNIDVVVTDADENVVFDGTIIANDKNALTIPDLPAGEYTITWSWTWVDGDNTWTDTDSGTITVTAGENASFTIPAIRLAKELKSYFPGKEDIYDRFIDELVSTTNPPVIKNAK